VDLSIVVVSWNTRDLLRACLASVQNLGADLAWEALVVDNSSTDGSPELVEQQFPGVGLIRNGANLGFARACNQGIVASSGRYVLLLNSDAVLLGDSAQRMVALLDERPAAAVVGGTLLHPDGRFQASYADFPTLRSELLLATGLMRWLLSPTYPSYGPAESTCLRQVDWVGGALFLVRRAALERVGLLDERFFMYAEEVDWCLRFKQAGWQVLFLPEARALHHGGASFSLLSEPKRVQLYWSKWLYFRKHRGRLAAATFRLTIVAAFSVKLLVWLGPCLLARLRQRKPAGSRVRSYSLLLARFLAPRVVGQPGEPAS
jgi:GT2 family glycosyltransferase